MKKKNHQRTFAIYKYLSQIVIMQDQRYKDRAKKLEEDVGSMINNENADLLETLELIDDLQRLGLGYRFERDITRTLDNFASSKLCNERIEKSLHATALSFRLLRQQGYQVSQGKKKKIYIYTYLLYHANSLYILIQSILKLLDFISMLISPSS